MGSLLALRFSNAKITECCSLRRKVSTSGRRACSHEQKTNLNVRRQNFHQRRNAIVMSSESPAKPKSLEEKLRMLAEAEKQWKQNVVSGKVKSVEGSEAEELMVSGEVTLLDVRPSFEYDRKHVEPCIHIPLYDEIKNEGMVSIGKNILSFVVGGWWSGNRTLEFQPNFASEARASMPVENHVLVACQSGQRSLAACDILLKLGYSNIAWLDGGFQAIPSGCFERGSLSVEGPAEKLQHGGIGGLSKVVGWTDIQRAEPGGRTRSLIAAGIAFAILDVVIFKVVGN